MPTKRKDGRYSSRIYLGKDATGKKLFRHIYAASPAELKTKEAELRHQLGKGLDLLSQRDSFDQWANEWLDIKIASNISDKQKGNYRRSVAFWIKQFPGYSISDVRPNDIERVLLALHNNGYAKRTIDFHRSTIRQIMSRATGRVISVNPDAYVQAEDLGKPAVSRRALTTEEQRWIWDTPGRGQAVAVIMMYSGLRRGELAALTWNDVDLKARTISVTKAVEYRDDSTHYLRPYPKTDASVRVVSIPKKLCDYLASMDHKSVLVIPSAHGSIMSASAWVKLWSGYMRELNIKYGAGVLNHQDEPHRPGPKTYEMTIPNITLHWLRHTFCTLMYFAGVDVLTASKQMGHASVVTTLKIYTHLDEQYKRKSTGKLDRYLSKMA